MSLENDSKSSYERKDSKLIFLPVNANWGYHVVDLVVIK